MGEAGSVTVKTGKLSRGAVRHGVDRRQNWRKAQCIPNYNDLVERYLTADVARSMLDKLVTVRTQLQLSTVEPVECRREPIFLT